MGGDEFLSKELKALLSNRLPMFANAAIVLFVIHIMIVELKSVLQPFLMALLVYYMMKPIALFLNRRYNMKLGIAYLVAMVLFLGALSLTGWFVWQQVAGLEDKMPIYQDALDEKLADLEEVQVGNQSLAAVLGLDGLDTSSISESILSTLTGIVGLLFSILTMVFFLAFIIFEAGLLEGRMARAFPGKGKNIVDIVAKIERSINDYIGVKTAISLLTGLGAGLICLLFGIDLWFVWGFLAFLFNYVPYIGSLVASAPPILLAFLLLSPGVALTFLVLMVSNQQFWGGYVETKWTGNRLDISPVLLMLVFTYGAFVWGVIGMILSAPIAVIVKIIFENIEGTRPIAFLMAERVKSYRQAMTEALEDGVLDRWEKRELESIQRSLGLSDEVATLIAGRAALDAAANTKGRMNDLELRMVRKAVKQSNLSEEEHKKIVAVLEDGFIDAKEADYLDKVLTDAHGEFRLDEEE